VIDPVESGMKITIYGQEDWELPGGSGPVAETGRQKGSSVRHTRAIQRDRSKRPASEEPAEPIAERLAEVVHPATLTQVGYYHDRGLRDRTLNLPVMAALVLSLIWRQFGSVSELARALTTEGLLWAGPVPISQQAISTRLRTFPADLFARMLEEILPRLAERWAARTRPVPAPLAWARERYTAVLAVDGSTLDALVRKTGLLRDRPDQPLAGRMLALLDVCSHLPRRVWYEEDAVAHDLRLWPRVRDALPAGALLVCDLAYTSFGVFAELTAAQVTFVLRAKHNLAAEVVRPLRRTSTVQEALVTVGRGAERQVVRLIAVSRNGVWDRYLTNELDPDRLPAEQVVALYAARWRIEEAFAIVKRLLGLAYFWVGSANGVQLQLWATWLLYAVLVDLTDAVADRLRRPVADLSLEMTYRSVPFFTRAFHRGDATDPVAYFATHAQLFGILKRKRRPKPPPASRLTYPVTTLICD
jgi:Transposase DDE domain